MGREVGRLSSDLAKAMGPLIDLGVMRVQGVSALVGVCLMVDRKNPVVPGSGYSIHQCKHDADICVSGGSIQQP